MSEVSYSRLSQDAKSAIAIARVTGSVGATCDGTQVQRLYTHQGGIGGGSTPTDMWLVTYPDGTTSTVDAGATEEEM
jgi:hypothetical protein